MNKILKLLHLKQVFTYPERVSPWFEPKLMAIKICSILITTLLESKSMTFNVEVLIFFQPALHKPSQCMLKVLVQWNQQKNFCKKAEMHRTIQNLQQVLLFKFLLLHSILWDVDQFFFSFIILCFPIKFKGYFWMIKHLSSSFVICFLNFFRFFFFLLWFSIKEKHDLPMS